MAQTLNQILGYLTFGTAIQEIKSGIPNPFPATFFSTTKDVVGDAARYIRLFGQRSTAKLGQYGAPARTRAMKSIGSKDQKLMAFFEEQPIDPLTMQAIHNYENYDHQEKGIEVVAQQTREFVQVSQNTRIAAVGYIVYVNGKLYFDNDGNLQPSLNGAGAITVETVDMGVNANNQNQLNGLVASSWDNNATDIPGFLRALKQFAAKANGYEPSEAGYGINIPTYMNQNNFVQDYLVRNDVRNSEVLSNGEIPQGLFGFNWTKTYMAFYEDATGTNDTIMNADGVTFTPPVSNQWYELFEGSMLVPTSINLSNDAEEALRNQCKVVYGQFGYGRLVHNPIGLSTFRGDTFMPTLKNPDVVYQAVVRF